MSFILDALRRADAERAREHAPVPGIHSAARIFADGDDDGERLPRRAGWPVWLAAASLALGVAAAAWWLTRPAEPELAPDAAAAAQAVARTAPSAVQPSSAIPPPSPGPVVIPPTRPAVPAAEAAVPSTTRADGAAAARPARRDPVRSPNGPPYPRPPLPAARPAPPAVQPKAAVRSPVPALPTNPADARGPLPSLRELPDALRRELPALAVSGAMYAPARASRMLVLDGQMLREGQGPRPGLVVETIGAKSAVLNYKGQRFELPY